jgi:CRISPR-associated protein Cmr6
LLETIDGGIEGGLTAVFTAEARGRIVVGLGAHSVRETNLALLHTWGVPYLPGSALKGLASAAAHQLGADPAWKKAGKQTPHGDEHARMFGDPKTAGYVVFHDAWWIPENAVTLPLDLDVMTVHHPDYYRDGRSAPADWDEPNPVGFLTAQGKYLVALSGPDAWVERAGAWLSAGLRELGLGAKTQAGYGRMTLTAVPTQRDIEATAQRAKHRATLDALANLPAQHKGAATARQHVEKLREAIRAGAPAAAVHEIARALGERDRKFWKKWAADERRTPEEQAFVSESGMIGPEPGGQTR